MSKLSDKIKSKVKSVKPKPKWQFVGYELAKEIVLVILWFIAVVGIGMVIYIISHQNPWKFLPPELGFWHGLIGLPWEMIAVLVILVISIYFISRKIHFVYRNNSWVILLLICTSVAAGYFIIEKTGLNEKLSEIQMAEEIYARGGKFIAPDRGPILIGKIEDIEDPKSLWIVRDMFSNNWQVIITDQTYIPTNQDFSVGKMVKIDGIKSDHTIEAFAIDQLNEESRGFKHSWKVQIHINPPQNPSDENVNVLNEN